MNAGDVEEVILVIIGEQALHLPGVHPAVRLRHINDGQIEGGKDVYLHPRHGEAAADHDRGNPHHDGDRMTQCEDDGIHETEIPGRWLDDGSAGIP